MSEAPPAASPVFLVAARRTGVGTLQRMLNAHPDIAFAPTFDFLIDAITPEGRYMKRDAFIRAMEVDNGFKRLGLTIPPGLPLFGIAHNLMDQVAATKPGAAVFGAVLQHDFDRILWLWPEARFIHFVRDGRDVALAKVLAGWAGTMWHGIGDWVDAEMLWERMSHKLPPERQISVKYEALAGDTEFEVQRLTDFLGVPFDPAMLPPARELAQSGGGRWRKIAQAEISAAEHRAARWLLQSSYFLSGTVRPPSVLRRIPLNLKHKFAVSEHRRSLFGTKLWLKGGLTKRFGSRKAKAKIVRLQSEILSREPQE